MAPRTSSTKVGYEPIPGYVLRKRLGAGGYGEVWLADAPGGLQKAVKLIYGSVDETHAASELRSLQRIRQVYHPFLLSLERIEIVGQQVVIITELAESSLLDRFTQMRRKGASGIPRDQLLVYLRDAADALDFLAQKHSLQHLDVKPGNLLIIADRIKVADFGLIKDLHDQNQSLVSGLTPVYSAPEIFDGRPDYRSDQYSLAIVYMEMLTGELPFNGKTTGELARQHINQAPSLDALPPADRPIVARALSKNPLDRFSQCKLFVEQLLKIRSSVFTAPRTTNVEKPESLTENVDFGETQLREATSTGSGKLDFQKSLDVSEVLANWSTPRSFFIGIGGTGCEALLELRNQLNRDCDNRLTIADQHWLAIDTDSNALDKLVGTAREGALEAKHAIQLPIYRPSEYRDLPPDLFAPISRRWLYNIPRSQTTEGVRPIAILTFLDHYPQLKSKLTAELTEMVRQAKQDNDCTEPMRIYLLSSLHGGTGSGLVAEIGLLIRRIFADLGYNHYRISAALTAATTTNHQATNLPAAAALSTLSEIDQLMDSDSIVGSIYYQEAHSIHKNHRPFDWITLVDGGLYGNATEFESALKRLASVVRVDSQTMSGALLHESRVCTDHENRTWIRAATAAPIEIATSVTPQNLGRWCCEQTLKHAYAYLVGSRGAATSSTKLFADDSNSSTDAEISVNPSACIEFANRLLSGLGLMPNVDTGSQKDAGSDQFLSQWARRVSGREDLVQSQLQADMVLWRNTFAKLVQLRIYNWRQVEQMQLSVIEGVLDFAETNATQILEALAPFESMLGSRESMLKNAQIYLRIFAESCMKSVQKFKEEGGQLAKRIKSWCVSIEAEKAMNATSWEVNLVGLPQPLQLLAVRVNAVLESSLHRLALRILDGGQAVEENTLASLVDNMNLQSLLALSMDLVRRISTELGIQEEDFKSVGDAEDGVLLKQLEKFYPSFAEHGAHVHRLVITPNEQANMLATALKALEIDRSTTIVEGTRSFGSYVYCDATNLKFAQLFSGLWRPNSNTLQLAERLRTRSDVSWKPVTKLLEITLDNTAVAASGSEDAMAASEAMHSEIVPPIIATDVGTQVVDIPPVQL